MAGYDGAMGGSGVGGWWPGKADAEASSTGSQSGEGSNASTPLPRIVSDIVGPGRPPATRIAATHQQGARQAAAVAAATTPGGANGNSSSHSFAEIPPTPQMPSGHRLAVLIKQSPSSSSTPTASHFPLTTTTANMKRPSPTTTTAASARRDQRVATTPGSSTPIKATPGPPKSEGQRPRGRPKGWKPGMSYRDVDADADADATPRRAGPGPGRPPLPENSEARLRKRQQQQEQQRREAGAAPGEREREHKRRGRPRRPSERSARQQYLCSSASFTRFLCEWVGEGGRRCPAELQNLATLRRHVYLVHGGDGDGDGDALVCRWGACARRTPAVVFADNDDDDDDDNGAAAAFEAHIERTHLRPFAWHVGDGVQVTPSVRDQRPEDEQTMRERKRRLRRLLIQRDEDAPDEEEYMLQTLGLAYAS